VSGACASLFSAAAASGYRSSPTCERDIAGAALIAAGQTSAGGLEGLEGTGAGSLADALALRAFATHPLVGSLDAARTLAAAALPMRSHSIYLSYQFSSFYGSELVIALKLTGRSPGWNVTQPRPGWHQWQTPAGRIYVQEPKRYPA
jgi:hypothetical protein